jgi:hypothetical protein
MPIVIAYLLTVFAVIVCVWFTFWLIDLAAASVNPSPNPTPRISLPNVCKVLVLAVALYVVVDTLFLTHRFLIRF